MAHRRRTAPQGDQPRLSGAIQAARAGGALLFLAAQRRLKALCNQALADAAHGIDTDGEARGNLLIRPGRPIRIGFQEVRRMADKNKADKALVGNR